MTRLHGIIIMKQKINSNLKVRYYMKRYKILIISILTLFISFVKSWYSDFLFDKLFILYIISNLLLFLLFNFCFITSLVKIVKERKLINAISIIILLCSILLYAFFPFRKVKTNYELNSFEKARLEIIDKIIYNELKPDDFGNVKLPKEYKKYSMSGEVTIYQNDKEGQVICFWIFRGMQSGSVQLMYSTGGEKLIKDNENGHPIINIEKLKDNWYYVETDY